MDIIVGQLAQIEQVAGSPDIALLIPVPFDFAIVAGDKHIRSDIKLPIVIQHGIA